MALLLPIAGGSPTAAQTEWQEFLNRRDALASQMEMATCDGCDGCGLRCMDGFTVSQQEWDAVQAFLQTQPASEVARVRQQTKTVPWPGAAESGVPEATVTFCPFRDMENGNCSVYPARPTVCRLFGHTAWLPCPIEAVTKFPEGAETVWSDYRRFERHTFAEWQHEESSLTS